MVIIFFFLHESWGVEPGNGAVYTSWLGFETPCVLYWAI